MRGLDVQQIGEVFVRLGAEDLEQGLKEDVQFGRLHGFDALGQRFGDLDAEFLDRRPGDCPV